jgi:multisubunit Na+/H+ antiporter MnhG subunit
MQDKGYQDILEKYKEKVAQEFGSQLNEVVKPNPKISSREYSEFKQELYPTHYSYYEKACKFSQNLLKLTIDEKKAEKIQKNLDICHLNIEPASVNSFSFLAALIVMVFGSLIAFSIPLVLGLPPMLPLVMFSMISGVILIPVLQRVPSFMANTWRMKASNQMVQSIFYMVTYMRHTSNLERAIQFAADHLNPPLSLDFRKILWDVETQKYPTIRDSANEYLQVWEEWDKNFVESFHLVESSLFEGAEDRRLALLDKSLDVILNGTYENMLHYAHSLKSPMTMLHMLGIILPILGLVILPLVVSFMGSGSNPFVTAIYISLLYNITLPISVYYLGKNILAKRPAGYGASDTSKEKGIKKLANVNLSLSKDIKVSINPLYFSLAVFIVATIIGFSPLILHSLDPSFEISTEDGNIKFLDYVCPPDIGAGCEDNQKVGPYGIGASILSVLFIAGLGGSIGLYYKLRSNNVIKVRERTKKLEDEFSSALFQLGNRLGDGIPGEIAFSKVAQTMRGTTSGDFFNLAEKNITKLGLGLEESIFDPKVGAIVSFPSKVIESSMKVLVESIKKGPLIAAQALLSMSRYIKEIHRVEERLKDLMSDVISSMKAQVKFLTPAIAGIVIGITSMISTILTKLSAQLSTFTQNSQQGGGGFGDLLDIFGIGIPTFHFQIVVGIYVVQLAYILTSLSSGVENGADKLGERFELGSNLTKGTLLYCFIAGTVMILFNLFASKIIGNALI